ncbi:MAG TPA: hypothetical protein VM925_11900 [Labilithrix sp.]|jgi:hypothetical protein|nr:hypothetical protein [Labilithrix sp.]
MSDSLSADLQRQFPNLSAEQIVEKKSLTKELAHLIGKGVGRRVPTRV